MSESQLIEYKESWRDEYLKWICASFACQNSFSKMRSGLRRFANAQGGVLYIGKRDDGSVCGVADSKKLMEDIPNKVRDALVNLHIIHSIIFLCRRHVIIQKAMMFHLKAFWSRM